MNYILSDLSNLGILVYVDDIIVSSNDVDSHLEKLQLVFDRLRTHNLKFKPSKCKILTNKIQYLGFEICNDYVAPINKNIEAPPPPVKNFKIPTSRKAVRGFLGTLTYNRRFIPDFSKRAINLTNLTKENGPFKWTPEAQWEFEDLKEALISKPCLKLPDFTKEFELYTDASGVALGAVLMQMGDDNLLHPVSFASRKLKGAETRYSATERELLALVWATAHFKCYLANTHFIIYTDHAPLTYVLKIRDPTSRLARWICTLSDFNFTPKYIKGKCNSVADFLSRYVNNDIEDEHNVNCDINCNINIDDNCTETVFEPNITLIDEIRRTQKDDTRCCEIVRKLDCDQIISPTYLKFFFDGDLLVCEDTRASPLLDRPRKLVVPLSLVPKIFKLTHDSPAGCHQGYSKTLERIREHFYWPKMTAQVKNLVESCISCQERRAHKSKHHAPLQRMETPSYPFQIVHSDCVGPLVETLQGNRFIITYTDAFSKWIEAYPVSSINSDVVGDTLADFISRHGTPVNIITDQGKNYMSDAIELVYKSFGIEHIHTSPFHPAGNGKCERAQATLINALAHLVNEHQLDWDVKLKFALLAMRTAFHDATKLSPAAVVYGRNLHLPYSVLNMKLMSKYADAPSFCELLLPSLQKVYLSVYDNLVKSAEKQEAHREKSAVVKNILVGDLVWLYSPAIKPGRSRKLSKLNKGPFSVIEKVSNVNFKIAPLENLNKTQIVHVDRLTKVKSRMEFPPVTDMQNVDSHDQSVPRVDAGPSFDSQEDRNSVRNFNSRAGGSVSNGAPQPVDVQRGFIRRRRRFFYPHLRQVPRPSGRQVCTRYDWRR